MPSLAPALALAALLSAPSPVRAEGEAGCLPPRQMQEALAEGGMVPPAQAVVAARRAVPGADVLRAALCRDGEAFVYRIMALRKDGRVVQVTVDAPSGRVRSVQ